MGKDFDIKNFILNNMVYIIWDLKIELLNNTCKSSKKDNKKLLVYYKGVHSCSIK